MNLLRIFLISICILFNGCVFTIPKPNPNIIPPLMNDSEFSDFEGPLTNDSEEVEIDDWTHLLD